MFSNYIGSCHHATEISRMVADAAQSSTMMRTTRLRGRAGGWWRSLANCGQWD